MIWGDMNGDYVRRLSMEKYAPVIIPTCNRVEHLVRCIESLEKNRWSDNTEVFISVDYPPNEKYNEGNKKIKEYLRSHRFKFKKINIYIQSGNLGSSENSDFLYQKAFEKYDRVIYTEDDNEFSKNFLEYMNKGLELFENDFTIASICGYNEEMEEQSYEFNVTKSIHWSAWGTGTWKNRYQLLKDGININYFDSIARDFWKMCKLYRNSKLLFCVLVGWITNPELCEIPFQDTAFSIYIESKNMCSIRPTVSKVRNWGFDGSGEHCGLNDVIVKQKIDIDSGFEYFWNQKERIDRKKNSEFEKKFLWVQREAKLNKTPLTWLIYFVLGRKKYFELKNRKNNVDYNL